MAEFDRLSQYRYLIRAMRVEDARSLEVARAFFFRQGIDVFDDDFVFRDTPSNLDFATVTRDFFDGLHRWKVPGRRSFRSLLEQYLTIFYDECYSCCRTGTPYLVMAGETLCTCCDFCGALHDLDGSAIERGPYIIANRKTLVERFGVTTAPHWSSLHALASLPRRDNRPGC